MGFAEFFNKHQIKIFIVIVLLFIPITLTLGQILFPLSLLPPIVEYINSLKEPYINWLIWIYSFILTSLVSFFGLFYIEKNNFFRVEWKKIFLTIILFIATSFHLISCGVFETFGESNSGWHYPCGVISKIENSAILTFGGLFNFDLLLILVLYLLSCAIIYLFKRLRKPPVLETTNNILSR